MTPGFMARLQFTTIRGSYWSGWGNRRSIGRLLEMPDLQNFGTYRDAYARTAGRSLAMPIAGAIVWTAAGVAGRLLSDRLAGLALIFGSNVIFPLALLLARHLNEDLLSRESPLARLMGASVLIVNLLWPLHIVLFLKDPSFLPLTLGVGLGIPGAIAFIYAVTIVMLIRRRTITPV